MSEHGGGGGDDWAFSEAKDWKDGRHRRENEHVADHAAEVSDKAAHDKLTVLESVYNRAYERGWIDSQWPASVQETTFYQQVRAKHDSDAYRERVETGDGPGLRAQVGSQDEGIDVSGWHDIERIREIVTERHLRLYVFGEPGAGKTRSACLASRHWLEDMIEDGHADAQVLTNVRSLKGEHENIKWTSGWDELNEEIDSEMDDVLSESVRPFLFLFDEASSQASGGGKDGYEAKQKLATLVYKIRKFGGAIIIIGHDGKDVHPAVRLLCNVLHKPNPNNPKIAQFYRTISNRKPKDKMTPEITGWPDSKWQPNDKDPAPWDWSSDEGEGPDDIAPREWAIYHACRARDAGVSVEDTAETVQYSTGWVSTQYGEYERGEEAREIVKHVAGIIE